MEAGPVELGVKRQPARVTGGQLMLWTRSLAVWFANPE